MPDLFHHLSSGFAVDMSSLPGAGLGLGMQLAALLVVHLIFAYPLYVIGQKTNQANPWFAFIPILNIILLVQAAELEIWWVIVCLIPCVNILAIYIWWKVAERMGKPGWVALLFLVPCVNLGVPFYIALA